MCDAPESLTPVSGLHLGHLSAALFQNTEEKGQTTQNEEKGNLLDDGELLQHLFFRFGGAPLFTQPQQEREAKLRYQQLLPNMEDAQGTRGGGQGVLGRWDVTPI